MRTHSLLTIVLSLAAGSLGCDSGANLGPRAVEVLPLTVIPSATTIDGGKTIRLIARVRHSDGSTSEPPDVTWRSANGAVATVDGTGVVSGLQPGQAQIVATWQDTRGSSLVTVAEAVTKKPTPECSAQATAEAGSNIPTGKCP